MTKTDTLARSFVNILSSSGRTLEIENEALRQILKENGLHGENLRVELAQRTRDPELAARVDVMIAPLLEGMQNALHSPAALKALSKWESKARSS